MWMLLQGVAELEAASRQEPDIYWTKNDVPKDWKRIVNGCVELDPNKRIGLSDLVIWEGVTTSMRYYL